MKNSLILLLLFAIVGSLKAQESLYEVQIYRKANNTIATTIYLYAPDKSICFIEELFALSDQNEQFRPVAKPMSSLPNEKETLMAIGLFNGDGNLVAVLNTEYELLTYHNSVPSTLCNKCINPGGVMKTFCNRPLYCGSATQTTASLTRRPGLK